VNRTKLNLGCGSRFHTDASWENVDYYRRRPYVRGLDLKRGLPFPDDTFEFIYSSHVLDHFVFPKQVTFILREALRCLKHGGVLRVSVPDLEFNCRRYLASVAENASNPDRHEWYTIELLDQMTRTTFGGQKAGFLRAARDRPDIQNWLRPLLGHEMLQHLDRSAPAAPDLLRRGRNYARRLLFSRSFENSGERHFWTYDWIGLSGVFRIAGFEEVSRPDCRHSMYITYGSESLDVEDGCEYKPGSLYVEGRKP